MLQKRRVPVASRRVPKPSFDRLTHNIPLVQVRARVGCLLRIVEQEWHRIDLPSKRGEKIVLKHLSGSSLSKKYRSIKVYSNVVEKDLSLNLILHETYRGLGGR